MYNLTYHTIIGGHVTCYQGLEFLVSSVYVPRPIQLEDGTPMLQDTAKASGRFSEVTSGDGMMVE